MGLNLVSHQEVQLPAQDVFDLAGDNPDLATAAGAVTRREVMTFNAKSHPNLEFIRPGLYQLCGRAVRLVGTKTLTLELTEPVFATISGTRRIVRAVTVEYRNSKAVSWKPNPFVRAV